MQQDVARYIPGSAVKRLFWTAFCAGILVGGVLCGSVALMASPPLWSIDVRL